MNNLSNITHLVLMLSANPIQVIHPKFFWNINCEVPGKEVSCITSPSSANSEVWSLLASSKVTKSFPTITATFKKPHHVFWFWGTSKGNQLQQMAQKTNSCRNFMNNQLGLVRITHTLIRPFAWTIASCSWLRTAYKTGRGLYHLMVKLNNWWVWGLVVWDSRGTR